MSKLQENMPLRSRHENTLTGLREINALPAPEKEQVYGRIIPPRLFNLLNISPLTFLGPDQRKRVTIIAPEGMALARIEVRQEPDDATTVFFLDIAETHYHQMELSFCIINDPSAPRFAVDVDENGRDNLFTRLGRNIPEEIRAMRAGLFPNQTSRGLGMFGEFFHLFELFVDALGMEIIMAEPLTYDNAVRYEKFGFDYLTGRRMMLTIDREFRPGGALFKRLDGSTPFRMPGMEKSVHGRSWAIHDGILNGPWGDQEVGEILSEPWDEIRIYKTIGVNAGINTFTAENGRS
ncbi:hypothetical protein OR1_01026 [Geobacter sp. OR-1]|uniref:hypothetical protein n=1 Tax=Geobacter sp. OR-1 TaxID=1266765 RepID=UPI000543944B|nr:hypothetical protein [Geobacter sp. OR-1]GAM08752.1 hypothetical protein OR1_01026 [Geobacter sp. OR-1]